MAIMTINDLQNATDDEVDKCIGHAGIIDDLAKFQQWCEVEKYSYPVSFELGGKHRSLGVHPSSACKLDACPQAMVWECTGEVEKMSRFDPDLYDTFDNGTAKHAMLQAQLNLMFGDQFQDEVGMADKELHIEGHTDGLFTFENYRMLLEIKTIKDSAGAYGYEKITRAPLNDNVNQLNIYMRLMNVPFGLLFYFNKNDSRKMEYVVAFDEALWAKTKDRIGSVCSTAYHDGPKPTKDPKFRCKWCGFLHACPEGKEYTRGTSRARRR